LRPRRERHGRPIRRCASTGTWILIFLLLVPAGLSAASPLPSPQAGAQTGADETLPLGVRVNGQDTGKTVEFTLRQGRILARPEDLRDIRIVIPKDIPLQPGGLIALEDLSGLTWKIDRAKLTIEVTAVASRLTATRMLANPLEEHRKIESGRGATLNYDAVGTYTGGRAGGTGTVDFRFFSPWGIVNTDWLAYAGATTSSSGSNSAIRLDSAYTFADVNTLRRYTLGDFITGGLAWTRPVHMEGLQMRRDFSTRPDLITFPRPSVGGEAAVPSTVTVLANGSQVTTSQVAPGPFQIQQLPVISGAGTISLTMTNALGQQVTVTQPFYAALTMLAPGLQTYAIQSGLVRRNWGVEGNDEGKIAGAAIYRRGLAQWFTFEGSAEDTPKAFMAGAGGLTTIGHLGVVNLAAAVSDASGQLGAQYSLGAQRVGRKFSLGASAIVADRNFRDVASMNGSGIERKQISAFASATIKKLGAVGAAYTGLDQDPPPVAVAGELLTASHSKGLTANYSLSFRHISFYATAYRNFSGVSSSNQAQFGVTIPFGKRSSANLSAATDGSGQVQAQQPTVVIGDWGYQAFASFDSNNHAFGQVQYKSPVGLWTAGIDVLNGTTTERLEALGAFSYVDGSLFSSNYVYDSFAIVDTTPVPHVHVLQENRNVGKTGAAGRLLVPDMLSFQLNRIGVLPTDIPPDASLGKDSYQIRPQDRSGVVVKFPIQFSHAALLRLVDERGTAIALGSTATLVATGVAFPIGYDGEAYVENLSPHNELSVKRADGKSCTVVFDYKAVPGDIPTIGPLRCVEKKP